MDKLCPLKNIAGYRGKGNRVPTGSSTILNSECGLQLVTTGIHVQSGKNRITRIDSRRVRLKLRDGP